MTSRRAAVLALLVTASLTVLAQTQGTITITTPSPLPTGFVDQVYAPVQLMTDAQGLLAWSTSGLPPGLMLNSNSGIISGTPIESGSYVFVVSVRTIQSDFPASGSKQFTLNVALGPLSIVETSIPIGIQNAAYTATLTASGGLPPYQWSFATTDSQGLAIDPNTGTITGTPKNNGSFVLAVKVTDSIAETFSRGFSFFVATPLTVLTSSLPNGAAGTPYSQTLSAGGGQAPYTWSISTGTLPPGLQVDSFGRITGTPTTNGVYQFTVQVSDVGKRTATQALSITIGPGLTITTSSLPGGAAGVAYSQTLAASGGQPPYVWALASGALPAGLQLDASSGTISGTPAAAGTFPFTVSATDAAKQTAQKPLTIVVTDALTITTGNLSATVGVSFSQTLAATGGTPPYTWSVTAGSLPAGLSLDASSGTISGTPTAGGSTNVTITVSDARGLTAPKTLAIAVNLPSVPTVTIGGVPDTSGPGQQPQVTISLSGAYPVDVSGTITLTFASSVGGDDQMIQFSNGSRTLNFTVPAGSTQGVFSGVSSASVLTGTVAGSITLTVSLSAGGANITPNPPPTKTIVTSPTVPFIQTVSLVPGTGGFTVVVTGFSSTREVISGLFHFAPATNATLTQSDITVQLGSAFTTWYQNSASNAFGSLFTLTIPFTVSGSATSVVSVTVTLTNTRGNSNPVSPQ